jgi:hypothetical protein
MPPNDDTPKQQPPKSDTKTGLFKAEKVRAQDRADEALDQERGARDDLVVNLKELHANTIERMTAEHTATIERMTADKDKIGAQYKWLMRTFVVEQLLILVMFGVAVGVVQDGEVNVPGLGTVNVGTSETTEVGIEAAPKSKAKTKAVIEDTAAPVGGPAGGPAGENLPGDTDADEPGAAGSIP